MSLDNRLDGRINIFLRNEGSVTKVALQAKDQHFIFSSEVRTVRQELQFPCQQYSSKRK